MAPGEINVSIPRAFIRASVALALTFVPFLTTSASGQSPAVDARAAADVTTPSAATASAISSVQAPSTAAPQPNDDRYRDGIIIWETPADAKVPFLLRFNINTQLRYLNTLSSDETTQTTSALSATFINATISRSIARCLSWAATFSTRGRDTASPSGRPPELPRSSSPRTLDGNSTGPLRSLQVIPGFRQSIAG